MRKVTRRELLKYHLPLGILSFIMVLFKKQTKKQEIRPKEARYYRNLAG